MRPIVSALLLAGLTAGCSAPVPDAAATSAASGSAGEGAAAGTPTPPPAPPTPLPTARSVNEDNDLYSFAYSYPAAAAAIPALKAELDADLAREKAALVKDAREGRADSKENGWPYNPYSHSTEWNVVTDLPGWLSLSALVGFYTGGAHPNYAFATILWDRQAGRQIEPLALFSGKAALARAITAPFCAALARERMKKRGEAWQEDGISDFTRCIDPLEQTVILGSSNHRAFDRIGFLIAPYNAGPYAEGSYEVTVPVTAAVLDAVKPAYRPAFAAQ